MEPSRQGLIESIRRDIILDQALFLRIYGYEISFPGFADEAIRKLEEAGYNSAGKSYDEVVSAYQREHDKALKPVAEQIRKRYEADWKRSEGGVEKRKQEIMMNLQQKSDRELLNLLQSMN